MNAKQIGEISEAQVLAVLLKAGKAVLTPFGDNQRYDLVVDENGKFIRVQCKTARIKGNNIVFHTGNKIGSYRGQAETFGIFCPENGRVYFIPVDDVPETTATLDLAIAEKYANELPWAA